jgi:hypothetical protein
MLDASRTAGDRETEALVVSRSRDFYLADRDCPLAYEPSGEDFLSHCFAEADLMRRLRPPAEFSRGLEPGVVTDPNRPAGRDRGRLAAEGQPAINRFSVLRYPHSRGMAHVRDNFWGEGGFIWSIDRLRW